MTKMTKITLTKYAKNDNQKVRKSLQNLFYDIITREFSSFRPPDQGLASQLIGALVRLVEVCPYDMKSKIRME